MPLIEELVVPKQQASAPGWAYVPDTGLKPEQAKMIPSGARNRTSRSAQHSTGDLTVRQQNRIQKHLLELEKENHRDVNISLAVKPREIASRGIRNKMTPGVRKIVTSQKTFANYLADEEAAIALQSGKSVATTIQKEGRVSSSATGQLSDHPHPAGKEPDPSSIHTGPNDTEMSLDDDPFLKSQLPTMPTEEEIKALLADPPLSYSAARAEPSKSTAPPRQFCEICGYWGRAKCMKCGARICGLECKIAHDETRCQKFYA